MKDNLINEIELAMQKSLSHEQIKELPTVLEYTFRNLCITEKVFCHSADCRSDLIEKFLAAKKVEGCSEKSTRYYKSSLVNAFNKIEKNVVQITTDGKNG